MSDALRSLGSLTIDPATNRVRVGAISSGLDTATLVQAMVDAKRIPALRIEQRIGLAEAKTAAYQDLRTALKAMQSALAGLRNPPGVLGRDENLFERKEAFFTSSSATPPGNLVGIQATNRADVGRFELRIEALASAHKVMSHTVADPSAPGLVADTLTIGLAGGPTADIAVTAGTSLQALRDAINAQSGTTQVRASILKVANGDHRLVLTGQETGADRTVEVGGSALNLATLGFAEPANELAAARNARLWVDGVAVERTGNTITDLYDGLTIDLYQAEPGTTVTVEVEASYAKARAQVLAFVEAYNGLRGFLESQGRVGEDGRVDRSAAPLFGDPLVRGLGQSLGLALGSAVAGLPGGAPSTLGELGITFDASNRLKVDLAKLDQRLLDDPLSVRRVFEFDAKISNPELAIFRRPDQLPSNAFTIDKVGADWILDDGTTTVTLEASGGTLKAPAGSAYAGLVMFYVGAADPAAPITVTATQGLADRLYALIERAAGAVEGSIQEAIDGTRAQAAGWRRDVERIDARAEAYRDLLVERFGRLETALSLSEAMLKQIRTQTDAMFARS